MCVLLTPILSSGCCCCATICHGVKRTILSDKTSYLGYDKDINYLHAAKTNGLCQLLGNNSELSISIIFNHIFSHRKHNGRQHCSDIDWSLIQGGRIQKDIFQSYLELLYITQYDIVFFFLALCTWFDWVVRQSARIFFFQGHRSR